MGSAADSIYSTMQLLTPEQLAKVEALIVTLHTEERLRATLSLSEPAFALVWNDPANDVYDAL